MEVKRAKVKIKEPEPETLASISEVAAVKTGPVNRRRATRPALGKAPPELSEPEGAPAVAPLSSPTDEQKGQFIPLDQVQRLVQRLSTSQDRLAKLARIEKAIADFHDEIVNATTDADTRRPVPTADGDTLAVINSLRTYMRVQRGFKEDYEKTLKISLKTATVAQKLEESHIRDELIALQRDHNALLLEREVLIVEMEQTEHGRALLVQEGLDALDRERVVNQSLRTELESTKIELQKAHACVSTQAKALDERENEHRAMAYELGLLKHTVHELEFGMLRRRSSTAMSVSSQQAPSSVSPPKTAAYAASGRELRQARLKIGSLEAEVAAARETILNLKSKVHSLKTSLRSNEVQKAQNEAQRLRSREQSKDDQIASLETALLKTRSRLHEKDSRLAALKSEYDKIFAALQKDSPQKASAAPTRVSNDEASRIANDNVYVTDYYKSRYEHQAHEILTLRKQIKKLLSLEHKQYHDQHARAKEHSRLLQNFQDLKRQLQDAAMTAATNQKLAESNQTTLLPASDYLCDDLGKLLARHEFLENFYRDHPAGGGSPLAHVMTVNVTMDQPPPPLLRSASTPSVLGVIKNVRPKSAGVTKPKGVGLTRQSFKVGALL
ncbi:hypothetical protein SDRG_11080 [Saprolegnia diclina VS20]|uniref:Uncharacterized protein n=1 Tax=Saprolegnia diclina (strain VS20) TaxID=1156394 RepID=T0RMD9_SAPDV|nr:hypothetical protein SDRG_11080 [Saprolegnia diclina VS20]EQC31152.1 hypothetical protein SDRG_11080 [Saprolegnia diclina VS20]|eukprot:XP_008615325.1 hypothetical protein SDRG_11080 [Saprolegnia diclina VS20]